MGISIVGSCIKCGRTFCTNIEGMKHCWHCREKIENRRNNKMDNEQNKQSDLKKAGSDLKDAIVKEIVKPFITSVLNFLSNLLSKVIKKKIK